MLPAGLPATTGWQPVLPYVACCGGPFLRMRQFYRNLRGLERSGLSADGLVVRPTSDFDRIASNIAIWHDYDPAVKAECYSTSLTTSEGMYLIDPIPLEKDALDELIGSDSVAGIIATNSNHHRASAQFAEQFSAPIFARFEAFPDKAAQQFRSVADGDEICRGLRVIGIEGAAAGEMILHYASSSGTLIVGDALINLEPYGFTFLPGKYCSNEKEMGRSLQKLLDYEAERILFGHGTPILSRASERLQQLLNGRTG